MILNLFEAIHTNYNENANKETSLSYQGSTKTEIDDGQYRPAKGAFSSHNCQDGN